MTERVLKKLELALEAGDYYGAHQMYLTVCNRYVKAKKVDEAVNLLLSGIKLLNQHKQYGSSLELSSVILKTWTDEGIPVEEKNLSLLLELLDMIPANEKEFGDLVRAGYKWTTKCGEISAGDPIFHHHVGVSYAEVEKLEDAQKHLMLGTEDSAVVLAHLIFDKISPPESDHFERDSPEAFINLCINPLFHYLNSLRMAHAIKFFSTFTSRLSEKYPKIKGNSISTPAATGNRLTFFTIPMLNFLQLIILTCQRGPDAAQGYMALCSQYLNSIPDNEPLIALVEKVGTTVFGIRSQKSQQNNMLQDLMSSLLGGMQ